MLNKLMARHRALRLGAGLLGASALAVGFASPALAVASSGGNAPSANYNIYQGGSNTTYLMMQQLADVFNQSPGCDLASVANTAQPLDYGCPGINDAGSTLSAPQTTSVTGNVANGSKTVSSVSSTTGFFANEAVSDTAGDIPNNTVIKTVTASTITLSKKATGTSNGDTLNVVTTPAVGENGFTTFAQQNPFNDLLIEEPALGSGNGIQELEDQGGHAAGASSHGSPINVSPLDVARSSRAPALTSPSSAGDDKGLNFVAYAMDAVTWLHWTSVSGTATPSSAVTNLSVAQLTSIYENQGCTAGGTTFTSPNWACFGGSNAPIAIYMAQNGSGTESTWASLLGLTGSFPFGGEDPNHVIFENETSSILANKDQADAIFFFSYGKFQTICGANPSFCSGASTSKVALGQIAGLKASKATIAAQLPGSGVAPFPGDRLLFNVYSNGSNPQIPISSPASLNAVSEDGFLCKPSSATDIDPNTGATYRSEINNIISTQGFFPLPLMVEDGQGATTGVYGTTGTGINNNAWSSTGGLQSSNYNPTHEAAFPAGSQDDDNSAIQGTYTGVYFNGNTNATKTASATDPIGFCLTESSDGNSTN